MHVTGGWQRNVDKNRRPVIAQGNAKSHGINITLRAGKGHNLIILENQLPPQLLGWHSDDKLNGIHDTRGVKERLPIKSQ
jgi:hypothetical protein